MVGHKATMASAFAFGNVSLYADSNGTLLPSDKWIPTRMDTIYDMSSLAKVFTAIAVLRAIGDGKLELYKPVASYLPEFAANGKRNVTILILSDPYEWLPSRP